MLQFHIWEIETLLERMQRQQKSPWRTEMFVAAVSLLLLSNPLMQYTGTSTLALPSDTAILPAPIRVDTTHFEHDSTTLRYAKFGFTCGSHDNSALIENYWVKAGKILPYDLRAELSVLMISPSNVGIANEMSRKYAVMGFVQLYTSNESDVCIRNEAIIGNIEDETQSNIVGFSWLVASPMQFDDDFSNYQLAMFDKYACITEDIRELELNGAALILIASLRHPINNFVTGNQEYQYDIVWIRDVRLSSYKVCWQDLPAYSEWHPRVGVDILTIVEPTIEITTYVAGIIDISWPGEDENSGFCVVAPFKKIWTYPPVMFVTLDNPGAANSADDTTAGVFIWVENVSSGTFEVCGSHVTQIKANIKKGSLFRIHYFGMPVVSQQNIDGTVAIPGKLLVEIEFECTIDVGACNITAYRNWRTSQAINFYDWIVEELEIPHESLKLEAVHQTNSNEKNAVIASYYLTWFSLDPTANYKIFEAELKTFNQSGVGILHYTSEQFLTYLENVANKSELKAVNLVTSFGMDCSGVFSATPCNKAECEDDGGGTFERDAGCVDPLGVSLSWQPTSNTEQCNLSPCSGSLTITSFNVDATEETPAQPDETSSARSHGSNASLIATIVLSILLVAAIAGWILFAVGFKRSAFRRVSLTENPHEQGNSYLAQPVAV